MPPYVCILDYEIEATRKMARKAFDYYYSGSDQEITLRANFLSFDNLRIMPRFLRNVESIDMSTQIFGHKLTSPLGVSPTAMHKLAHPKGELATAKGITSFGSSIMTVSTLSSTPIEQIAEQNPQLVKWFQLYLFKDRNESVKLIKRAEKAGFSALVLTVDAPVFAVRRRDIRNNFKVPANFMANFEQNSDQAIQKLDYIDASIQWDDITWLREVTKLPILIKGLLTPEDAILAIEYGATGIVVSNHGGRQLDSAPASIEALPGIVKAVKKRCPIIIDGGIRTGADIFKCLALGADLVFVGRPILWGLACQGASGVTNVLNILKDELEITMKLAGCPKLGDIDHSMVVNKVNLLAKL